MASNSFLLEGWLITLIAVMLALSKDSLAGQNPAYRGFCTCYVKNSVALLFIK